MFKLNFSSYIRVFFIIPNSNSHENRYQVVSRHTLDTPVIYKFSHHRGGPRISGKKFACINVLGFAMLVLSHFLKYPIKMK